MNKIRVHLCIVLYKHTKWNLSCTPSYPSVTQTCMIDTFRVHHPVHQRTDTSNTFLNNKYPTKHESKQSNQISGVPIQMWCISCACSRQWGLVDISGWHLPWRWYPQWPESRRCRSRWSPRCNVRVRWASRLIWFDGPCLNGRFVCVRRLLHRTEHLCRGTQQA